MTIDPTGLDLLFREARSHNKFTDEPVSDDTLRQLYDIVKMGPTSANSSPARFLFLRTKEAKERLAPALSSGNLEKTMAAPVTVIVAYDTRFTRSCRSCSRIIRMRSPGSPATTRWPRRRRSATEPCRALT